MSRNDDLRATLESEGKRLKTEAENATDKFNKGYFEGRAEQCCRFINFMDSKSAEALDQITED